MVCIHINLFYLEKRKDPGIPNLYPFKEQLLKQIEERKEKVSFIIIIIFLFNSFEYS